MSVKNINDDKIRLYYSYNTIEPVCLVLMTFMTCLRKDCGI